MIWEVGFIFVFYGKIMGVWNFLYFYEIGKKEIVGLFFKGYKG